MKRPITNWSWSVFVLAAAALTACGNYSNDDVDFQIAVPAQDDITAKLPAALVSADSAEYYRATHDVVAIFNNLANGLTDLVDHVRASSPSQRNGDARIWGPFPLAQHPEWQLQLLITREPDRFAYALAFRATATPTAAWQPLMTGNFEPSAGVRRGKGALALDLTQARLAGYPVDDPDLLKVTIDYNRIDRPITVKMVIENLPQSTKPGSNYQYTEQADGSGSLLFIWRTRDNVWATATQITSRWLPTGAGRADARITEGLAATVGNALGIDCWGLDARPTYVLRNFGDKRNEGSADTCVFPAP